MTRWLDAAKAADDDGWGEWQSVDNSIAAKGAVNDLQVEIINGVHRYRTRPRKDKRNGAA